MTQWTQPNGHLSVTNKQYQNPPNPLINNVKTMAFVTKVRLMAAFALFNLSLAGCTGGSDGGGNITISTDDQATDPVVVEVPIAYIKRPLPADDEIPNLQQPLDFSPGAQLFVRNRSTASGNEIAVHDKMLAIAAEELGADTDELAIDIKHLNTSFDGEQLIFSARIVREPVNDNTLEQTTWNIWVYEFATEEARYLISSQLQRNEGLENGSSQDLAPHFLTDDRVVFSSTRQIISQGRQLNEGRGQIYAAQAESGNQPATVLHIYDPSGAGTAFTQISFNQSHDFNPTVLESGVIVFSRWDRAPGNNQISLYQINPNGLDLSLLYGHHSGDSGSQDSNVHFFQPREMEDGRILAILRRANSETLGGDIIAIDTTNFVERDQPIWADQPGDMSSMGQQSLSSIVVRTDDQLSEGGQYTSAYPLHDGTGRILVSWSPCRVVEDAAAQVYVPCNIGDVDAELAPPLYGIWMNDPSEGTQLPVVLAEEGFMFSEVVAAEPRDFPQLATAINAFNNELANDNRGQLLIDSVYDFDGAQMPANIITASREPGTTGYTDRPARFIRLIQPVPLPDRDILEVPNYAFGFGGQGMKEILGYAPVEPDGSLTMTVPANTPFMISVLDSNGRRIGNRHNHWLQVAPGEVLHCTGCHERDSELPHGRLDSQPPSSNPGAQSLAGGSIGFVGTLPDLFGTEIGETMAEIFDLRRPLSNAAETARAIDLHPLYTDEWTDTASITPDADINYSYDPTWEDPADIPADRAIIVANLDPTLDSRIVINYIDHIQAIWNRTRTPVNGVDSCVGCHTTQGDTVTAPGQLDLTDQLDTASNQYRSFRELLLSDNEQWLDENGLFTDRTRTCTEEDEEGNITELIETITIRNTMSAAGANNSGAFFRCFEGGSCGNNNAADRSLDANCSEAVAAMPSPPTSNTVNHQGMLSDSEKRLISEWLDIGAQYYNNPFDLRLQE